jgi:CheY-like chemotaxis protein
MSAKILVIDDEPAVASVITRMLRDYDTSTETDPRRAVDRISHGERFDLILCDLNMPEMSGREVYEAVQRESGGRPPMMLIMSGQGNVEPLYAVGCAVLFKPFEEAELENLVSMILHDDAHGASAPVR